MDETLLRAWSKTQRLSGKRNPHGRFRMADSMNDGFAASSFGQPRPVSGHRRRWFVSVWSANVTLDKRRASACVWIGYLAVSQLFETKLWWYRVSRRVEILGYFRNGSFPSLLPNRRSAWLQYACPWSAWSGTTFAGSTSPSNFFRR